LNAPEKPNNKQRDKYQNAFFIFGLVVLAIMVTQLDFTEAWDGLRHAGYWFLAIVILWAFLYLFNTASWMLIIRSVQRVPNEDGARMTSHFVTSSTSSSSSRISFWWLYKVSVSGFALNYATPGGLMGGEPYRIMELAPKIGTERASSSVILYVMTHIFCHFCFWGICIILFLITQPVTLFLRLLLGAAGLFCVLGIWFFLNGYRKGLAVRMLNVLRHFPYIRKWSIPFVEKHKEQLDTIDRQIAALHRQSKSTFVAAVLLEVTCRFISAFEVMFALLVLTNHVSYLFCLFTIAFTTLFANLLFFIPLQLGGREGGFLMSITQLGMSASSGIFVALLVRLRELIWTGIGLLMIKFHRRQKERK